jgi:RimJ/RimL family protein N-acetyltransferase
MFEAVGRWTCFWARTDVDSEHFHCLVCHVGQPGSLRIPNLRREDYEHFEATKDMTNTATVNIVVNNQIHLSEFRPSDKHALVEHLNDRDIYDRTLRIPFPYTEGSADNWLTLVADIAKQQARQVHWAMRSANDALIGACGFNGFQVGKSHQAEVGYWLGKPFWGQGIMTAVVQRICRHAFEEFGLVKIIAHVHPHNPASVRVLEKCGFQEEGFLRKHCLKDGNFLDVRLFGLLHGDCR